LGRFLWSIEGSCNILCPRIPCPRFTKTKRLLCDCQLIISKLNMPKFTFSTTVPCRCDIYFFMFFFKFVTFQCLFFQRWHRFNKFKCAFNLYHLVNCRNNVTIALKGIVSRESCVNCYHWCIV
jgi:hypothetical protein